MQSDELNSQTMKLKSLIDVDSKDNLYNPDTANFIDGTNLFGFKPKDPAQRSDDDSYDADLGPAEAEERMKGTMMTKDQGPHVSSQTTSQKRYKTPVKDSK